jgi:hypothetical protein
LPYLDTGLRNLFADPKLSLEKNKDDILDVYQDISGFVDFAITLGVMDGLEIRQHEATQLQPDLFDSKGNKTSSTINKDYFINCLLTGNSWSEEGWHCKNSDLYIGKLPLYSKSMALSEAVWKTSCRAKPEQLHAHYRPNEAKRHLENKSDSFFIRQLKNCALFSGLNR